MRNPLSSLLQRRRERRRERRDLRKLASALGQGVRAPVYVGDSTVLAPTHYGQWIYLAGEDASVCPRIMTTGTWEPGTTAFLHSHLLDGSNYVEVGANYGYFALQAGVLVGDRGRVDAFEPLPRAATLIRRTFDANGAARRSHVHQVAVSDRSGTAVLHTVEGNHGSGQLNPHRDKGPCTVETTEVSVVALDDALEGRRMDFLKMDAQGVEGLVLAGARETLARSLDLVMVFEMHGRGWEENGRPAPEVLAELKDLGFRFWRIEEPTGRTVPVTPDALCQEPEAVFDFVCSRRVPPARPGMRSMVVG